MTDQSVSLQPSRSGSTLFSVGVLVGFLYYSPSARGQAAIEVGNKEAAPAAIVLSPFVVKDDKDAGYYASQTMAGGRLKQDIKDTGSSIQVVTKAFMTDIGATGVDELLQYTTGTEVAGILGNFVGADDFNVGEVANPGARNNPDATSRVRGLAAPDRSRNFFKTDIPIDTYNIERIDINRGANSFLFGLGSPAGLIDTTMAKAHFKNENEISTRLGSGGKNPSYRGSFNINRVLVDKRLAIYVAALMDRTQYRQEPTYKDDDRQYGAITYRPFKHDRTVITAHVENGRIRGNSPQTLLPVENLSTFLNDPVVGRISIDAYANLQRFQNSEGPNRAQYNALSAAEKLKYVVADFPTPNVLFPGTWGNGSWGLVFDGSKGRQPAFAYTGQYPSTSFLLGDPFWDPQRAGRGNPNDVFHGNLLQVKGSGLEQGFTDLKTFDFSRAHLGWNNDFYTRDFVNYNVAIEQTFWKHQAGFEVAFDYQDLFRRTANLFAFGTPVLFDINRTLLLPAAPGVAAALPNPNFGRPLVQSRQGYSSNDQQRSAARFTGFIKYDFAEKMKRGWLGKLLGRHSITGLADQSTVDSKNVNFQPVAFGDPEPALHIGPANAGLATTFARGVPMNIYLGPAQLNAFTDPKFTIRDFKLIPADYQLLLPANFNIAKQVWSLGPDANRANLGQNSRINGNEGWVNGVFSPRYIPAQASLQETKTTSFAANTQSFFWDKLLVANMGYRQDTVKNWQNTNPRRLGLDQIPDVSPGAYRVRDGVLTIDKTSVFGYGGVLYWPKKVIKLPDWIQDITFHYNDSQNFVPSGGRINELKQPVVAPSGRSKDRGISFYLFNNKVVARLNWYDSSLKNASSSVSTTFNQLNSHLFTWYGSLNRNILAVDANNDGIIDQAVVDQLGAGQTVQSSYPSLARAKEARAAILPALTPALKASYNYVEAADGGNTTQQPGQITDLQDITSRGFEADITLNPTPNWRIAFNAAKQETALSNIAPRLTALLNNVWLPHLAKYGDLDWDLPVQPVSGPNAFQGVSVFGTQSPILDYYVQKGQEGRAQNEQKKWRLNLVTNYQFTDGRLRGFSVGGAVRWQDVYATGYPIISDPRGVILPDIAHPFFSEPEISYDLTFGYRRRILQNVNWTSQINIRNLQNWDGEKFSAIRHQPDGSVARVRFDPPFQLLWTNTFRF